MNELHHALDPAGPQAAHIAELWWLTLALCGVVFVAILAAFLFALWRTPRATAATPPDLRPISEPEPRAKAVVGIAVGLAIVGLLALLVGNVATDRALAHMPIDDALHIEVTGHQWWWDVLYDDPQPARRFTTANEIHIPVGKPVLIKLESADVIHSFWVPSLHGKKDLIPARVSTIELRADRPGVYRGQCAEFCGMQHAKMAFDVVAETPEAFARWSEQQRQPAREPPAGAAAHGRDLFLSGPCMMCHAIGGTTASAHAGPDLTHVASRPWLGAHTVANDREHLARWIENAGAFKPGVQMPPHHASREDLDAIVAYLETLK
jgi:cytochrome c oxidase subunit II